MIYIQIGIFLILHFCLRIKIQRHWFCRIYTFSIKFFKVLWTRMIRYLFFLDIYQKNNTSTKKQKKKSSFYFLCILRFAYWSVHCLYRELFYFHCCLSVWYALSSVISPSSWYWDGSSVVTVAVRSLLNRGKSALSVVDFCFNDVLWKKIVC